jgi:hypothetical protein
MSMASCHGAQRLSAWEHELSPILGGLAKWKPIPSLRPSPERRSFWLAVLLCNSGAPTNLKLGKTHAPTPDTPQGFATSGPNGLHGSRQGEVETLT